MPVSYLSVGLTPTRVRLVFSEAMLVNAALSSAASYAVTTMQGVVIAITSVTIEQATHPRSVTLQLGSALHSSGWYQVELVGAVQSEAFVAPTPVKTWFQFLQPDANFNVRRDQFTGEQQGGLFGTPAGLVFFSPALLTAIPNSVIQVDSVQCCSTAYDQYNWPQPVDPQPFFTWSATALQTTIGQAGVALWAPFPRLVDARFEIRFPAGNLTDQVPTAEDCSVTCTLVARWDLTKVSLLNSTAWRTFDNVGEPPSYFRTADNTAPIAPGTTTHYTLLGPLFGDALYSTDSVVVQKL